MQPTFFQIIIHLLAGVTLMRLHLVVVIFTRLLQVVVGMTTHRHHQLAVIST